MQIIDVLRASAEASINITTTKIVDGEEQAITTGCKSFGHGPRAYSNLSQENEAMDKYGWGVEFPRIWVYPIEETDAYNKHMSAFDRIYSIVADVHMLCDLDASSQEIENCLRAMRDLSTVFIWRLKANALFKQFDTDISKIPVWHYRDANLAGYILTFKMQLKEIFDECLP